MPATDAAHAEAVVEPISVELTNGGFANLVVWPRCDSPFLDNGCDPGREARTPSYERDRPVEAAHGTVDRNCGQDDSQTEEYLLPTQFELSLGNINSLFL